MQPEKPIITFISGTVLLALFYYFLIDTDSSFLYSAVFGLVSCSIAMGLSYAGEKVRRTWFANNTTKESK